VPTLSTLGQAEAGAVGEMNWLVDFSDWLLWLSTEAICEESKDRGLACSRIESIVGGWGDEVRAKDGCTGTGDSENLSGKRRSDLLRVEETLAHSPTKSSESLSCDPNGSSESKSVPTKPW
jgi:hypothetical protein